LKVGQRGRGEQTFVFGAQGVDRVKSPTAASGGIYWVASTIVPMPGEDGLAHQHISVRKAIHDFEQTSVPNDDPTCMAVRCNASVDDATAELELAWRLNTLGALRQFIGERARMAGLSDDDRDALILEAYEAATNVIRHTTPSLVDLSLLVRVKDAPTLIEISLYYIDIGEP
jgi:hypothetical protein